MDRHQRKYLGREEKKARQQRLEQILDATVSADDVARAEGVRALCPCRGPWPRSVWIEIIAACEDTSPKVRLEALHVLADQPWPPHPRTHELIRRACRDPDPQVAARAADHLHGLSLQDRRIRAGASPSTEEPAHPSRGQARFREDTGE